MSSFTIEHNGATFDFGALPLASQRALAYAGIVHHRGNRVASKVVGTFRTKARQAWIAANSAEAWGKLSDADVTSIEKAGVPATDSDAYRAMVAEILADTDAAIMAGSLGEGRPSAVKLSPLETESAAIAKRETIEILTKQGLFVASAKRRVPKADDEFILAGKSREFAELCESRLARFADRIEREAKKVLADREKAVARVGGEDLAEAF